MQPKTIEPIDVIRTTIECLEVGEAVPKAEAAIVAMAFRQYLAGETDITRNLGLRPRRGGCHEMPIAIEKKSLRNDHIKKLFNAQPGRPCEKAKRTEHLLKNPELTALSKFNNYKIV